MLLLLRARTCHLPTSVAFLKGECFLAIAFQMLTQVPGGLEQQHDSCQSSSFVCSLLFKHNFETPNACAMTGLPVQVASGSSRWVLGTPTPKRVRYLLKEYRVPAAATALVCGHQAGVERRTKGVSLVQLLTHVQWYKNQALHPVAAAVACLGKQI